MFLRTNIIFERLFFEETHKVWSSKFNVLDVLDNDIDTPLAGVFYVQDTETSSNFFDVYICVFQITDSILYENLKLDV